MKEMLKMLATSKRTAVVVAGIAVSLLAKYGLNVDADAVLGLVTAVGVLVTKIMDAKAEKAASVDGPK